MATGAKDQSFLCESCYIHGTNVTHDEYTEKLAQAALRGYFGEGFNNMKANQARQAAVNAVRKFIEEFNNNH